MNPQTNPEFPTRDPLRIPDLVSEQELAELTENRPALLKAANQYLTTHPKPEKEDWEWQATRVQFDAAQMGCELADFLEIMARNQHVCERANAYVRRLAGYARQLEALALGELQFGNLTD